MLEEQELWKQVAEFPLVSATYSLFSNLLYSLLWALVFFVHGGNKNIIFAGLLRKKWLEIVES